MKDYRAIIKRHREEKGLSQYRLAKQLGITQTFLSEIERGRKNPSLEQFFRMTRNRRAIRPRHSCEVTL